MGINLTGARILVADDDSAIRLGLVRLLTKCGAQVVGVEDGDVALRALTGPTIFDLAILDLSMPRVDGYEVLDALRSDSRTALLPVLVLSAWQPAELKGANVCLSKPFELDELLATVESLVLRYGLRAG